MLPKVLLTRRSLESLAESHPVRYYSVVSSRTFLVGCPADSKPIVAIEFCYRHIPCSLCGLPSGAFAMAELNGVHVLVVEDTDDSRELRPMPPRRGMLVVAAAGF